MGRKKEFPDRITLPLPPGVVTHIDLHLGEKESRVEFIREAIEREIRRRERRDARKEG